MTREIPGYEGRYSINEYGEVFNIKRNRPKLSSRSVTTGYFKTSLADCNRKTKTHLIHRLVALTFIPNPESKREVNHKDGNKANNHITNLEWVTTKENSRHAHDMGLIKPLKGENASQAKLTNKSVLKIFNSMLPNKELAAKYNVDICVIYQIKNGKNYSSVTGKSYKAQSHRRPRQFLLKVFSEVGSNSQIAEKYNLSTKEVWRIKNSKPLSNILYGNV